MSRLTEDQQLECGWCDPADFPDTPLTDDERAVVRWSAERSRNDLIERQTQEAEEQRAADRLVQVIGGLVLIAGAVLEVVKA